MIININSNYGYVLNPSGPETVKRNTSISRLYILYQMFTVGSSILGPASVSLMIAGRLSSGVVFCFVCVSLCVRGCVFILSLMFVGSSLILCFVYSAPYLVSYLYAPPSDTSLFINISDQVKVLLHAHDVGERWVFILIFLFNCPLSFYLNFFFSQLIVVRGRYFPQRCRASLSI